MKTAFLKTLGLSLMIATTAQVGHSAALKKTTAAVQTNMVMEKSDKLLKPLSPIEKALSQQKRDRHDSNTVIDNDQIKVMTTIQIAPTQNFFAEQHQRFSRFVQSIFPQHS
ncbi:DUF4179 domain-containing protein [Acinetobacter sp. 187]|uniref:DUF4179 domain-containing protein n=1 Tax=Acinetobacter lanii TaxID=2715163 RepID=UPI00140D8615|nr:DUF4179 domain-containing protein [Acinetobacter lanii]NHC03758.1 DUF4179 domain-containing protein [Acinetobacter lanii]